MLIPGVPFSKDMALLNYALIFHEKKAFYVLSLDIFTIGFTFY
jgi:hypothetical protein